MKLLRVSRLEVRKGLEPFYSIMKRFWVLFEAQAGHHH